MRQPARFEFGHGLGGGHGANDDHTWTIAVTAQSQPSRHPRSQPLTTRRCRRVRNTRANVCPLAAARSLRRQQPVSSRSRSISSAGAVRGHRATFAASSGTLSLIAVAANPARKRSDRADSPRPTAHPHVGPRSFCGKTSVTPWCATTREAQQNDPRTWRCILASEGTRSELKPQCADG